VVGPEEMRRLDAAGELEWYEPDGILTLLDAEPSQYYASDKWDLAMIGADAAFERGCLGQGVRIGILDSGVNHLDCLKHCLLPGHNYISGADEDDTADNYGHGTLVAGLIAGSGADGYLGAAPRAELVPLKVTDGKTITISAICSAIYGAVDDYGCDILNLSLGMTGSSRTLLEAVEYAERKGVTVVSAVGNTSGTTLYYPAAYDTVIGVGSVDRNGRKYYRSSSNESVFITAPGVNVKTAGRVGGYVDATGTSFSVPQVVAAAAILLSINGSLTPADVRGILAATAVDKGDAGRDDDYGHGLLSIARCVAVLANDPEEPCRFEPESGPAERFHNGTEETLECIYYLARYDDGGRCLGVRTRLFTLAPGESAALEAPDGAADWAQLVCDANTFAPLTEARKK
jgi:subtilisin family serine protease